MPEPKNFSLSAAQIKGLDAFHEDTAASERVLGVAMNFYANRTVELNRRRREWWTELGEHFGFDPKDGYSVGQVDGEICIVPEKPKPQELHLNHLITEAAAQLVQSCSKAAEVAADYTFAASAGHEVVVDTSGRDPLDRDPR